MVSPLRARILMAALKAIVLALMTNGIASYTTVKRRNNPQVSSNLSAVVQGHTQAINEWLNARYTMLASISEAAVSNAPLSTLRQQDGIRLDGCPRQQRAGVSSGHTSAASSISDT